MSSDIVLEKKLNRIAYIISFVVILAVIGMRRFKIPTDIDFGFLPPFHALLNSLTAVLLLFALYFIEFLVCVIQAYVFWRLFYIYIIEIEI